MIGRKIQPIAQRLGVGAGIVEATVGRKALRPSGNPDEFPLRSSERIGEVDQQQRNIGLGRALRLPDFVERVCNPRACDIIAFRRGVGRVQVGPGAGGQCASGPEILQQHLGVVVQLSLEQLWHVLAEPAVDGVGKYDPGIGAGHVTPQGYGLEQRFILGAVGRQGVRRIAFR